MESRLDDLFCQWQRLGAAVFVSQDCCPEPVMSLELLLATSTNACRDSSRLTWVILGWLVQHPTLISVSLLLRETRLNGNIAVLGVLAEAAYDKTAHPVFKRIAAECKPNAQPETFFNRVAKSAFASAQAQVNTLEVFRRWNFWCDELEFVV